MMTRHWMMAAAAATGLVMGAVSVRAEATTQPAEAPTSQPAQKERVLPSGLKIIELHPGHGDRQATAGDTISAHYVGRLENGKKFDASRDHGGPITFKLGAGQVIKGWDEGIEGMKVGESRKLIIPPDLAYGERGAPPVIPPNATLIFTVELVGIQ